MDTTDAPTREVTLLHRILYVFYRASMLGLRRVPIRVARRVGRWVGHLYRLVDRRRWRVTLENLAGALPDVDPAQRERIARECFAFFGSTLFDATVSIEAEPENMRARFDVEGWEHIEAVEKRGTGYAIMSAHWGAWEALARYLGLALGELNIISRPPTNPLMVRDFREIRRRYGHVLVHKRRAGFRMLRLLKDGGRIGILIDQRVRPKDGILEPFLGPLAWTSPLLAFLALKTGAPVVPVYCAPTAGGRYLLRVEPPIEPGTPGPEAASRLTRAYLASVEGVIRAQPELWMWMHRRWQRTAPVRGDVHIRRYRGRSGLPDGATFAEWTWTAENQALETPALMLASASAVDVGAHALIHGSASAGHLAAAIGHQLIDTGHEVRFVPAAKLVEDLIADEAKGDRADIGRRLDVPAMLIIADLDDVAADADACDRLRALVTARHHRRSTVLVALATVGPWRDWLADDATLLALA